MEEDALLERGNFSDSDEDNDDGGTFPLANDEEIGNDSDGELELAESGSESGSALFT